MIRVAECQAARGHLPRRPERFGELGIRLGDLLCQRGKLLVDPREARLVFFQVALVFQIPAEKADFLDEFSEKNGEVAFHPLLRIWPNTMAVKLIPTLADMWQNLRGS